jgi:transposase InsO family protein
LAVVPKSVIVARFDRIAERGETAMSHRLHSNARTTPQTRAEISQSKLSIKELMIRYSISKATVLKWRKRSAFEDRSHRPHTLHTTLSSTQEWIVCELRRMLDLPIDDLVAVTKKFINPAVSRSGIIRLLKREGMESLREQARQQAKEEGKGEKPKTFKDYDPGFIHLDIKYLPKMPDEDSRRYLFVAIDRATRWVFLEIYPDQTEQSSVDFLARLQAACPVNIQTILTDNGTQFTDRFTSKKKEPSGRHVFDQACTAAGIEHRLIPPRHPQTNGMVERFNGRISEVVAQTRFACAAELEQTLKAYLKTYNHHIPQRNLGHISPIQALKDWQIKKPELFLKKVYNHAGLDN